MPIGGLVISVDPDTNKEKMEILAGITHLEIHGSDDKGNIVAVVDTQTTKEMQNVIDHLNNLDWILSVGMTYINVEDEAVDDMSCSGRYVFEEGRDKEISA